MANLEQLTQSWKELSRDANGAIGAFQEFRKCLSYPGTYNWFFNLEDLNSGYDGMMKNIAHNFGYTFEMSSVPGSAFLELRKLPKGQKKLPSDLKCVLNFPEQGMERQVLGKVETSPYDMGVLLFYGEACDEFGTEGRIATCVFNLVGDYSILTETFKAVKENPKYISNFVVNVFEWGNDTTIAETQKRMKSRPAYNSPAVQECRRIAQLRDVSDTGVLSNAEPDVTIKLNTLYALDVGEGYSWLKRAGISLRKKNDDVEIIRV
ncbi:hypothetical protein HY636_04205 [Candidatus Woesearchaeota archaeon]|nr:hypothetical protein [Candidatus Woesearchaeota archaeon]